MKLAAILLTIFSLFLYACNGGLGNNQGDKSVKTNDEQPFGGELAQLQGNWISDAIGYEMGSGMFLQTEVSVKGQDYYESSHIYFSLEEGLPPEKRVLIASIFERSTIKITSPANNNGIVGREEIITESLLQITDITKNKPDQPLAGNVTPRFIFDTLLSNLPDLKTGLANIKVDDNNQMSLSSRIGMVQQMGHKLIDNGAAFENYLLKKGEFVPNGPDKFKKVP